MEIADRRIAVTQLVLLSLCQSCVTRAPFATATPTQDPPKVLLRQLTAPVTPDAIRLLGDIRRGLTPVAPSTGSNALDVLQPAPTLDRNAIRLFQAPYTAFDGYVYTHDLQDALRHDAEARQMSANDAGISRLTIVQFSTVAFDTPFRINLLRRLANDQLARSSQNMSVVTEVYCYLVERQPYSQALGRSLPSSSLLINGRVWAPASEPLRKLYFSTKLTPIE